MRIRVGERSKAVVIFLARCIPEGELNVLSIDLDIGNVVFEDSGNVHLVIRLVRILVIGSAVGREEASDCAEVGRRFKPLLRAVGCRGSNRPSRAITKKFGGVIVSTYLGEGALGENTA